MFIAIENNTADAIGLSCVISAFIVSVSMSLYLFTTTGDTIQKMVDMNTQLDKNIHTTLKVPIAFSVSGAQVRQSLYVIRDIGVDIEVNGVMYSTSIDPTTLDVSSINLNKKYTPTYIRDDKGALTMLRFN
ncbi:hypothetical protein [Paenibacillus sp. CMAA1364]